MRTLDGRVILKWAVLSAALVFAAFAGRNAVSVQEPATQIPSAERVVDGVRFRLAQVKSDRVGEARVVVEVYNETDNLRALPMELQLSEVVYTGSAMSRVMSADDYKETIVDKKTKNDRIMPQAKNKYPASLRGRKASPTRSGARYVVKFLLDGKAIMAIDLRQGY